MISLAAEGGYQVFSLNGEAWFWLVFSAVTALLLDRLDSDESRPLLFPSFSAPDIRPVRHSPPTTPQEWTP